MEQLPCPLHLKTCSLGRVSWHCWSWQVARQRRRRWDIPLVARTTDRTIIDRVTGHSAAIPRLTLPKRGRASRTNLLRMVIGFKADATAVLWHRRHPSRPKRRKMLRRYQRPPDVRIRMSRQLNPHHNNGPTIAVLRRRKRRGNIRKLIRAAINGNRQTAS